MTGRPGTSMLNDRPIGDDDDRPSRHEYVDDRPIGHRYGGDWYFSAPEFDELREHVEQSSEGLWEYSGGADLVLVSGWLAAGDEPVVDWASTISGQLTDQSAGTRSLTLANVIEKISRDLATGTEDASYGVSEVTDGSPAPGSHIARDFLINTLAGIAAALGARALGV